MICIPSILNLCCRYVWNTLCSGICKIVLWDRFDLDSTLLVGVDLDEVNNFNGSGG